MERKGIASFMPALSISDDENIEWYTPVFSEGGEHVHHKVADIHVVIVIPLPWHPHGLIQNGIIEKWIP